MRKHNVEPVLKTEFLCCNKKKTKPRLHYTICEAKCKKYKECHSYKDWHYEYYGKEVDEPMKKSKIMKRKCVPRKKTRR
jgi:hypothetical protein